MNANTPTPEQFGEFFEALYGYGPFPWQSELARRVGSGPTGRSMLAESAGPAHRGG